MRSIWSAVPLLALISGAAADDGLVPRRLKPIPFIESAVHSLLTEFVHYPAYHGPTGTATAAIRGKPTVSATPTPAPYWLEQIKHQGISAFNPDKSYQVFRNVKDFGAKGK